MKYILNAISLLLLSISIYFIYNSIQIKNISSDYVKKTRNIVLSMETLEKSRNAALFIKTLEKSKRESSQNDFLDLIKEKKLFGLPDIDIKLMGIIGDKVLFNDEWYEKDIEKNGITVLEINNDYVLLNYFGQENKIQFFTPSVMYKPKEKKNGRLESRIF